MRFTSSYAVLASVAMGARASEVHGQNAEGTTMGPVAFLWPADRPWSASKDNIGPCGSAAGVTNRTAFPLSHGEVALTIADEAWQVDFHISFDDEPKNQSAFTRQAIASVAEIEPGHQCYRIGALPKTAKAGSNATIQLEYWSEYRNEKGGRNQTFFACADVTLVKAKDFNIAVPCFNVTSAGWGSDGTATSSGARVTLNPESDEVENSDGLDKGVIAGIVVGTVVGSSVIVGILAFFFFRKRRSGSAAAVQPATVMAKKADSDADSFTTVYTLSHK